MHDQGLNFIKQNKKKNPLHLAALLFLLIMGILGGMFLEKAVSVGDTKSLITPEGSITITIGGSYNPPPSVRGQNPSVAKSIAELFAFSDLRIVSLAAPVDNNAVLSDKKGPAIHPSISSFLKESKINIVQLSDHRILSFGAAGLINTLDFLHINGIQQIGVGLSKEEALAPIYFSKEDKTIAILALNANPPPGWAARKNRLGVAFYDSDYLPEILKDAGSKSDAIIVLISFTNESSEQEQKDLARKLIDQGINVIVGTGMGPLQKVERYKHGVIFYNIGNLSSPPAMFSYAKESVLLKIALQPEGKMEIKAIPLIADHSSVKTARGGFYEWKISKRLGDRLWILDI